MENTKFTRVWDEEKGKFVFKPAEETPEPNWCCVYGDWAWCEEDHIEEAKADLLALMIHTIRELAKKDEFWIIKKVNSGNPLMVAGCPIADVYKAYTVGWKAEFPQMMPKPRQEVQTNGTPIVLGLK